MFGGGIEQDSADGQGIGVLGSIGVADETWVSFGAAKSAVDLGDNRDLETAYADIGLDHFFDPIGVNVGVAYWGDSDVLESIDYRASGYFRNESLLLSLDYEYRDFDLTIPRTDFFPGRDVVFDADGLGLTARLQLNDDISLRLRGIKYDYSIDFRPADSVNAARLLSVSRLSLINSLVDHRAGLSLSINQGRNNWNLDVSTWESIFTESRTMSYTVRFLMPSSVETDIEFGLGYDDSELYGDVTFVSVYLFFYGN